MISIEDLSFQYSGGTSPALKHISLNIEDGDFIGVIGNSGAGKSTLTYALNGIVPHHYTGDFYGRVLVNGLDTVETLPEKLSVHVGSVFQDIDGHMVASMVENEILFGLENYSVPHSEIEERITSALDTLGISSLRHRAIRSLSGGQKQKVAIAAVLALHPGIIVLDEPTGELDPQSSRQVFETLRSLNELGGITIVIVEQKIMLLCEFAKKLLVMDNGTAACAGSVGEVLKNSALLENLGINIPRVATLAGALRKKGLYFGDTPADIPSAEKMVRDVLA